jgi:hypothetical protein
VAALLKVIELINSGLGNATGNIQSRKLIVQMVNWIFLVLSLSLVPQFIHDHLRKRNNTINFWQVAGLSFDKIAFIAYFNFYQANIFRNTPSVLIASISIGLIFLQIILLPVQQILLRAVAFSKPYEYNVENIPEKEKHEPCSICMEPLGVGKIMQTPCKHHFHKDCLTMWLDKNPTCPQDRINLPHLETEYENKLIDF